MSKINTGMQRASSLTVVKSIGGVQVYSRVYDMLSAFLAYQAITQTECAEMSVADYQARLAAFKLYVEGVEVGLVVDTAPAYRENKTSCPII